MLKRMDDAHKLLQLLAGCPDGVTQHALTIMHEFAPGLLYRCVEQGLVTARQQTVDARGGNKPLTVWRMYITDDGRKFINGSGK